MVQERDTSNLPQISYTRGNDLSGTRQGAGGIGGLLARTELSTAHAYYHCDANGNIVIMVNTNGQALARYSYDPYGNLLSISGPLAAANLYRFSSKEYHVNSGLVYYLYRFYAPNRQRWLNRDPIQERGGIHLYAFAINSPLRYADAFGLQCVDGEDDEIEMDIEKEVKESITPEQEVEIERNTKESEEKYEPTAPYFGGEPIMEPLVPKQKPPPVSAPASKPGVVYRVPPEDTPSQRPYIGRTSNPKGPPGRGNRDGRDRTDATIIDTYDNTPEGRAKEQKAIDENGGLQNLDNKRNEIAPKQCPSP